MTYLLPSGSVAELIFNFDIAILFLTPEVIKSRHNAILRKKFICTRYVHGITAQRIHEGFADLPAQVLDSRQHTSWLTKGKIELKSPHLPCINVSTDVWPSIIPPKGFHFDSDAGLQSTSPPSV